MQSEIRAKLELTKQKIAFLSHSLSDDFIISLHLDGMAEKISSCTSKVTDVISKAEKLQKFEKHLQNAVEQQPGQRISTKVLISAYDLIQKNPVFVEAHAK